MEKESGIPKPGDLFIGVIDLFAVLVPGLIAAALILVLNRATLAPDAFSITGLLVGGWVFGHVLHGIGSWLDPLVYDRLFRPKDSLGNENLNESSAQSSNRFRRAAHKYFHKNDDLYRLAKQLTELPDTQSSQAAGARVPGGMYQWARAWLISHNPESTSNLDRLEADSKLFRSLAVLLLIAIPAIIMIGEPVVPLNRRAFEHPQLGLLAIASAGLFFSLWRYCDLRNKMVRQCYLNYVQARFELRSRHASEVEIK